MKTKIGKRTIKTAIAVLLALLVKVVLMLAIDIPTGQSWSKIIYTPFFGGIAAAYSMHSNMNASRNQAKIRTMGSIVGGLYGMVILIICQTILHDSLIISWGIILYYVLEYLIVAVAIIPMIHLTVVTKKTYATWIACLTYLSVTVSIRNDFDDQLQNIFSSNEMINSYVIAVVFALNRILSTIVGVCLSLVVNHFKMPHKTKNQDILFCIGVEGMLASDKDRLVGYANYQLNHMVDVGAQCTLFTTRVPRTFMHLFGGVKITQPIVCMSGAALYDAQKLTYLGVENIPMDVAKHVDEVLEACNVTPFKNYIFDDVLNVYCEKIDNLGEELMAKKMKNEGYGNYFKGKCPYEINPLFYLMIEEKDRIPMIIDNLNNAGLKDKILLQVYDYFDEDSENVKELAYVKIYSKEVEKLNLLKQYAEKNDFRIAGLTTSELSNHLLDNSEIKVTSACYDDSNAIRIDSYEDMFRNISHIYYGKEYKRK